MYPEANNANTSQNHIIYQLLYKYMWVLRCYHILMMCIGNMRFHLLPRKKHYNPVVTNIKRKNQKKLFYVLMYTGTKKLLCIFDDCQRYRKFWGKNKSQNKLPVLDVSVEPKSHSFHCSLQDKNTCKEKVENLQCKLQLLKVHKINIIREISILFISITHYQNLYRINIKLLTQIPSKNLMNKFVPFL